MRCRLSPTADVPSQRSGAAMCPDSDMAVYSITSSALNRMDVGRVIPSALAVLRFATSLKRVGRSMGKSATEVPCNTLRVRKVELPRDCRRLFGLSYAAMAACSSMA